MPCAREKPRGFCRLTSSHQHFTRDKCWPLKNHCLWGSCRCLGRTLKQTTGIGIRIGWRPAGFSKLFRHMGLTIFEMLQEKEMATHSSVLALRIPGTGEPGGLPSMGSHRVGHDWSDLAAAAEHTEYTESNFRTANSCHWEKLSTIWSSAFVFSNFFGNIYTEWRAHTIMCMVWCILTYEHTLLWRHRTFHHPRKSPHVPP